MALSPLTRRNLINNAVVICASIPIGALIGVSRASSETFWRDIGVGAVIGLVIASGCSAAELWLLSNRALRWMRRVPPVLLMLTRGVLFNAVILFGLTVPNMMIGIGAPWQQPEFWQYFVISSIVAFTISTGIEITRLLGSEATLALVSGRYTHPRLETRVVMFADIVGSTALAEQIGELAFHNFLRDVANDLAIATVLTRGNVYRYVGDAVIVTWPLDRGTQNGAALTCAAEMHRLMETRAPVYTQRYGATPALRIAIHAGQVAAGEIGDWKKEIALLGDTMNTTARIEGAAKTLGVRTVVSDAVLQQLPSNLRTQYARLPEYDAAGKHDALILWTPKDDLAVSN